MPDRLSKNGVGLTGFEPVASSVSSVRSPRNLAYVRQARSRCQRYCPGLTVNTLSRSPHRARSGHVHGCGGRLCNLARLCLLPAWARLLALDTVQIISCIFRIMAIPGQRLFDRVGHDVIPLRVSLARTCSGVYVRGYIWTLARNDRPGAAQALSRDAAFQRACGVGIRRSLAAPLRVAVGVKNDDQPEGE